MKPSTPFFVSDSEVMLPLVYLASSQSNVIVDSMRFLFQRLDLTTAEQSWDTTAEGNKIRILTDATFLYAQVDQSHNADTVSVPQLSTKDIERAFSYSSAAHRFSNPTGRNKASVQIELQADCLAGVWAKQTEQKQKAVEPGDIDEAVRAAAAVGDDRLQKMTRGDVMPDSFTHGSSAQRVAAFKQGYGGASAKACVR